MTAAGYILLNKAEDFSRGISENMEWTGSGMRSNGPVHEKSIFLSGTMDSGELEMEWHRLVINGEENRGIPYRVSVYSSDRDIREEGGEPYFGSAAAKMEAMADCLRLSAVNEPDILLHGVRGRYLWIALVVYGPGRIFRDIRASFPGRSFLSLLPEVFQREDGKTRFLERYLGIFQSLYEDLNERIDRIADSYDTELADRRMLDWMASWLDLQETSIWSDSQLRTLLKKAMYFFAIRGTRTGISGLVELYTGEPPFLVESWQLKKYTSDRPYYDRISRLYPVNPSSFCILVREIVFQDQITREGLGQVLEMTKPVHTDGRLIILNPYLFLGGYSYLGINTELGYYKTAELSDHAGISLTVLEGAI